MTSGDVLSKVLLKLQADTALAAAAPGGVFQGKAPENTPTPFVSVGYQSPKSRSETVANRSFYSESLIRVKVIDENSSPFRATDVNELIFDLLENQDLTLDGGAVHDYLAWETDIFQEENTLDRTFQHVGAVYRVVVKEQ